MKEQQVVVKFDPEVFALDPERVFDLVAEAFHSSIYGDFGSVTLMPPYEVSEQKKRSKQTGWERDRLLRSKQQQTEKQQKED